MPFIPNNPETKVLPVAQTVEKNLDIYHIHSFQPFIDPNNLAGIMLRVQWSRGYMEGDAYISVESFEHAFSGAPVLQAIGAPVTPGNSRYDEIKFALWQLLVDAGKVPEGTSV